jgi:hypothetical protein
VGFVGFVAEQAAALYLFRKNIKSKTRVSF